MTKTAWILTSIVTAGILVFLAWFAFLRVNDARATFVDACIYNCPVVHFVWTTKNYGNCPTGYAVRVGHSDQCRLIAEPHTIIDRPYTNVEHSVDVAYIKSSDPHKCHRPSDSQLEDEYGLNHDAVQAFKDANSEWKDSIKTAPEGYYINDDGQCVPNPTPTSSITPTPTPYHYACNSDHQCVQVAGEGQNTCESVKDCEEVTPTPTPPPCEDCVTPTPTPPEPTPTPNPPSGGGLSEAGTPPTVACDYPTVAPTIIKWARLDSTSVALWWTRVDNNPTQSYLVFYGLGKDSMPWNVIVSGSEYTELHQLPPNQIIWASVRGYNQGCIGPASIVEDP